MVEITIINYDDDSLLQKLYKHSHCTQDKVDHIVKDSILMVLSHTWQVFPPTHAIQVIILSMVQGSINFVGKQNMISLKLPLNFAMIYLG